MIFLNIFFLIFSAFLNCHCDLYNVLACRDLLMGFALHFMGLELQFAQSWTVIRFSDSKQLQGIMLMW